jgi:fructokinase
MSLAPRIVAVGEILWDLLPDGDQPGGAPANFAYHARALGNTVHLISRVGHDPLGERLLNHLEVNNLDSSLVQRDPDALTGTVSVEIRPGGHPTYTIRENVAWDHIEVTEEAEQIVSQCHSICFGTLAQRHSRSRASLLHLLKTSPPHAKRVFDVNLRQHFYSDEIIRTSLEQSSLLKVNDEELPVIAAAAGCSGSDATIAHSLLEKYHLELIALTRGSAGSTLFSRDQRSDLPAPPISVRDTIGAGDSFTAALLTGLLRGKPLAECHRLASSLAAWVCTQPGATPSPPQTILQSLTSSP